VYFVRPLKIWVFNQFAAYRDKKVVGVFVCVACLLQQERKLV
jgi:hypothetical protein